MIDAGGRTLTPRFNACREHLTMQMVLVHGTIVVKNSKVLKDVCPGQPIRNPIQN